MVKGLCDGGSGALIAEGEDFDFELAGFVADVEEVADLDFAGGLGALAVGGDAAQVEGFRGLFAGLEEARGPEPLVDADAGHTLYFRTKMVRRTWRFAGITWAASSFVRW